jgi:hypothetical protein
MLWIDTETDADAHELQQNKWRPTVIEEDNSWSAKIDGDHLRQGDILWTDACKELKGYPKDRLLIAVRHMPLPGAFKEACISLRAVVREARKDKVDCTGHLSQLYFFAAVSSFCLPYSETLQTPGFNIFESMPFSVFESRMNLSWHQIGYKSLDLLNKTDVSWMLEVWGEPARHRSTHQLYSSIWQEYEEKWRKHKGASRGIFDI